MFSEIQDQGGIKESFAAALFYHDLQYIPAVLLNMTDT